MQQGYVSFQRSDQLYEFVFYFRLELLDRVDPPAVQDGYGMSLAFYSLLELNRSVQFIIEGETKDVTPGKNKPKAKKQITGLLFILKN